MRFFEPVKPEFRKHPEATLKQPKRATKCSAGYDFYSPIDVEIAPQTSKLIWTDFKACMNNNEVLFIVVTSGMGKKGVMLANTIGVIDSDYRTDSLKVITPLLNSLQAIVVATSDGGTVRFENVKNGDILNAPEGLYFDMSKNPMR